jgi:hypothetical protein
MEREYEVTVKRVIEDTFHTTVKASCRETAAVEGARHIGERHKHKDAMYLAVNIEELFQPGEEVFHIEDDHNGFWVEILGGPRVDEEDGCNDYIVKDPNWDSRETEDGSVAMMEFLVPFDQLTRTPFRTGYHRLGEAPAEDNMLYFHNSEAATEHMEKYYKDVDSGILTGNDLLEWTAMLDGKRNSAMVNGMLYWIQPLKRGI